MAMYDVSTQPPTWDINQTNSTETPVVIDEAWTIAYNVVLVLITVVIMFSMGSTIQLRVLKVILQRPIGPVIGGVCQLILMPAVCCGYALLLKLPDNIAIGMLLVGCIPGGAISNIITYWTKADVILSVCMTTMSTTLAIGFLPLNMFIYSRFWGAETVIPYLNMVYTILYLWASVIAGYFIGHKWPKTVPFFTKVGSIFALLLIFVAAVIQGKLFPGSGLLDHSWQTYVASITMPLIGFVMGFVLAWVFCLGMKQRLAIGFETGLQNTALGLTIIAMTFPSSWESSYYSQYVILYTSFQTAFGIATVIGVWLHDYIRYRETPCQAQDSVDITEDTEQLDDVSGEANGKNIDTTQNQSQLTDSNSGVRVVSVVSLTYKDLQ